MLLLGKTHQKKTKAREEEKKNNWKLLLFFFLSAILLSPPLKWFWNSHEHIEKTEAYKRPCPGGTKQNWVTKLGNI